MQFTSGEVEQTIEIELLHNKEADLDDRDDMFILKLSDPDCGAKISKKDVLYINLVGDNELMKKVDGIEKVLNMINEG